jgi:hypothetical protein
MDPATTRFAIRYSALNRALLTLFGAGPGVSYVEVDGRDVRVRMGFAFHATIPRLSIVAVGRRDKVRWNIGVHGWRGWWIVNGTSRDLTTISIDPRARARVLGVPVSLRELWISLEDPEGFRAAIGR